MADFNKIIPFILRWETGYIPKTPMTNEQLFYRARLSGWSDDPRDLGGATMCGITIGTYTEYCKKKGLPKPTKATLRCMPFDHWRNICKSMYWDRWQADKIRSQSVAEILVDWVWASGSHGIVRPQKLLGVTCDGVVGTKTLEAINKRDSKTLWKELYDLRVAFINSITTGRNACFKKGWMNRLNSMRYED